MYIFIKINFFSLNSSEKKEEIVRERSKLHSNLSGSLIYHNLLNIPESLNFKSHCSTIPFCFVSAWTLNCECKVCNCYTQQTGNLLACISELLNYRSLSGVRILNVNRYENYVQNHTSFYNVYKFRKIPLFFSNRKNLFLKIHLFYLNIIINLKIKINFFRQSHDRLEWRFSFQPLDNCCVEIL
ncbi:hypothetical protein BpHYR1_052702 [Brachionus plicatilis]|uniref:Uncharacterized protein n=1 Tax=Brachionus plicatilis TaxID=10195 RepID=A0A3M7SJU9_BRAPC|nr:hypothetical protein BpHYR1_052702 [Brachionus plicatilis]